MKRRILIVQPVVPHYRTSFFRLLQESNDLTIRVAAADRFGGMQSDPAFERARAPIRPLIPGKAYWQTVDTSDLRAGDGLILSGNAHFLNLLPDMLEAHWRGLRVGWWGHWRSTGRRKTLSVVRRALSLKADVMVTYSAAEREAAIAFGSAAERTFAAPNTIDDRRIRQLMSTLSTTRIEDPVFSPGQPYFLSIGRLIPAKRVDLVLRALAAVTRPYAPGLVIVGAGPEQDALRDLAASLGISRRVRFAGSVTRDEDLLPYFSGALATVSAGPIGLAAPHSLAFHVPVIFVDVSNGPEEDFLVPGFNSLRCAQSEGELSAAMVSMLSDPALAARLKQGACESAHRDVSITKMAEGFLAACRHLVTTGTAGGHEEAESTAH